MDVTGSEMFRVEVFEYTQNADFLSVMVNKDYIDATSNQIYCYEKVMSPASCESGGTYD